MVAGEVGPAVGGVSVDGVGLQQVLGAEGLAAGTLEPVDLEDLLAVAAARLLAGLLLAHAAADQGVEDEGDGARELEGSAVVALDVLVAHVLVVVVEHAVGTLALGIPVWGGLLD